MAAAPYQLWMDLTPISLASRSGSVVTITTTGPHGLQSGAYVQIDGMTSTEGTSMNTVAQIVVTSGSAFTYVAAGSAGSGTVTSAVISLDLLSPLQNYASGTARQYSASADVSSLSLTANGDGSGATMSATILQEITPSGGPWFELIPDQTRVRFAYADTGSVPASTDVLFLGYLAGFSASMNGSGQGTIAQLNLNDVNALLENVAVYGKAGATARIVKASRTGAGAASVATITCKDDHAFSVGQKINIAGVSGGGAYSFNGKGFTITGISSLHSPPGNERFTYTNPAGLSSVSNANQPVKYTVARDGKSRSSFIFTAEAGDSAWIESGQNLILFKSSATARNFPNNAQVQALLFSDVLNEGKVHSGKNVTKISDTSFRLSTITGYTGAGTAGDFTGTCRLYTGQAKAWDASNTNGQTSVIIKGGQTETAAVQQVLNVAHGYHATDYPLQRLISTSGTAGISGGTAYKPAEALVFPSTSLRSALDSIVENYQTDTRLRRYYVTPQATLAYSVTDGDAVPTYATAPYKIIVDSAGSPNSTASAPTVAPYNLAVDWDHETIKRAQFNVPSTSDPSSEINTIVAYDDLVTDDGGTASTQKFPTRAGAPIFDSVVDFPNATPSLIPVAASAWFTERYQPRLSGRFSLRGAGTAAHNSFGFLKGYYQSGTAFVQTAWSPGQFVEITAPSLSLSGLYRVEEVALSFESSSFNQVIDVTFNRKNPNDLATIIANQKG